MKIKSADGNMTCGERFVVPYRLNSNLSGTINTFRHYLYRVTAGFLLMTLITLLPGSTYGQKKKSAPIKTYGPASYNVDEPGKFMQHWLIAGPIKVSEENGRPDRKTQESFFRSLDLNVEPQAEKMLPPVSHNAKNFPWTRVSFPGYIADLDSLYNRLNFVAAYAIAEIISSEKRTAILALGSDDGIRVWLNGKLVHDNWIPRRVTADQDIIALPLDKGSNQIIIKVQDIEAGWGFCARLLDGPAISKQLLTAAGRGDLDQAEQLLDGGANVNYISEFGMTPIANARINGRDDMVKLLTKKGSAQHSVPSGEILTHGLYRHLQGRETSGVAVLIAKDGKVLYSNGFGYANLEKKQRITPSTKFRIGSITKQFTAAAILKLQEEGKLNITDKLSKYFPDFPRSEEVTIQHLLNHTSGIHSYTSNDDFVKRVVNPVSPEELVKYFKDEPYDFNPGEAHQYSNSGYILAGLIVEKVSGKSLDLFLKQRFFTPLKMNSTGIYLNSAPPPNEALGYKNQDGNYSPSLNWDMSWAGGAGALYSTVEDLFLWNEAVFTGKVLNEKSMQQALTAGVLNNGQPIAYGLGWALNKLRGEEVYEHGGGLHGFISQLSRYKKNNLTVVILTNTTPTEVPINASTIAEYFIWPSLDKQTSFSSKNEKLVDAKQYEGRYDFQNGMVMLITSEENNLYAQLSGQNKFPIFPAGNDEFFWKVVDARIKFVKDSTGVTQYGEFSQNGYQLKIMKLKTPEIVPVNPAIYKDYIGKFDYGNNVVITITTDGQHLFAQATNQPKFQLFPTSETDFVFHEINGSVVFVRGDDGLVKMIRIDLGQPKREAQRIE